jgi:hypothetical protein
MSLPWTHRLEIHTCFITRLRVRLALSHSQSTVLTPRSLNWKNTVSPLKAVTRVSLGVDQTPHLPPNAGLNLNPDSYQSDEQGSQVGSWAFPGSCVQPELTSSACQSRGSLSWINTVQWHLAGAAFLVFWGHKASDKEVKHHPPNPRWTPRNVAGGLRQRLRGQQSFWEAGLLSKPAVTQRTHVQRPSPENKGGFPYIPLCNWNSRLGMLSQWQGGENSSPPEILQEGSDRDRAPKLSGSKFIKQNSSNSA